MTLHEAQLTDKVYANRSCKERAMAAISKLELEELWDAAGALQVTHTLARTAERYKMTYRELSVALMESLPEEWRERIDPLLEDTEFVRTNKSFEAQGEKNSRASENSKDVDSYSRPP
jgi:hypothetical protein